MPTRSDAAPLPRGRAPGLRRLPFVVAQPVAPSPPTHDGGARRRPCRDERRPDACDSWNVSERRYLETLSTSDAVRLCRAADDLRETRGACEEDAPLRIRVLQSHLPDGAKRAIFFDLASPGGSSEKYLQWVRKAVSLPLGVIATPPWQASIDHGKRRKAKEPSVSPRVCLADARKRMDDAVVGHDAAKRYVMQLVSQTMAGVARRGYALGLEGPPGTGKTHFVHHAMSAAMGLPLVSIPLGGATDSSFLLGNLYTYEGSKEGRLVAALVEAGCANPIIHFDEVDKVSASDRGQEVIATLIHLVDPSANASLRDRYFHGIDIDFSQCTFVFSYNDASKISPVLLDRLHRIEMPAPTAAEVARIVSDQMVPRAVDVLRLPASLRLSQGGIEEVIQRVGGREGVGVRRVDRAVQEVLAAIQLECFEKGACEGEGRASRERVPEEESNASTDPLSEPYVTRRREGSAAEEGASRRGTKRSASAALAHVAKMPRDAVTEGGEVPRSVVRRILDESGAMEREGGVRASEWLMYA